MRGTPRVPQLVGCGVLDRPLSRTMTAVSCWRSSLPAQAGNPVLTNDAWNALSPTTGPLRSTGSSAFADDDGGVVLAVVIARESGQSSTHKRCVERPACHNRSAAEYWIVRFRGR